MGTCSGDCCSSDGKAERRAKKLYKESKQMRPQPKKIPSNSHVDREIQTQFSIDAKTIELLSHLEGMGTPIDDGEHIPHFNIPNVSNIPNIREPISFELHEIEKNVTSIRVKKLTEILDAEDLKGLQNVLNDQYASDPSDHSDNDERDESSLSESDKLEIQKRKTDTQTNINNITAGPALYRDKTTHDWDIQEIDSLKNDIEKQLLSLQKQESNKQAHLGSHLGVPNTGSKQYKIVVSDMNSSLNDVDHKLFRNKSADQWNDEDMDTTKQEMQKELGNLMLMHVESNKNKAYNKNDDDSLSDSD